MAQRLAADGAHVIISSRKQENVDNAVEKLKIEGLSVSGMVCHVGKKEDREKLIENTVEKFGGFDILISNAAVNPDPGRIMNVTDPCIKLYMYVKSVLYQINFIFLFFLVHGSRLGQDFQRQCEILVLLSQRSDSTHGEEGKSFHHIRFFSYGIHSQLRGSSI